MQNLASAVAAFNTDGALIIFDGSAYSGGSMTNYTKSWANELVSQQTPRLRAPSNLTCDFQCTN